MKQAQGSKVKRLAKSPTGHGPAAKSSGFNIQAFHTMLPDSFFYKLLKTFVAQFAGGLMKHITSGYAHRNFSLRVVDPEQGRRKSPRHGRKGFTDNLSAGEQWEFPMCSPDYRGLREVSLSQFGRSMVDKVSWQLVLRRKTNGHRISVVQLVKEVSLKGCTQ